MKVKEYVDLSHPGNPQDVKLRDNIVKALPSQEIVKRGQSVIVQLGGGTNYLVKKRPQLFCTPIENRNYTVIPKYSNYKDYCKLEPGDFFVELRDRFVSVDGSICRFKN